MSKWAFRYGKQMLLEGEGEVHEVHNEHNQIWTPCIVVYEGLKEVLLGICTIMSS